MANETAMSRGAARCNHPIGTNRTFLRRRIRAALKSARFALLVASVLLVQTGRVMAQNRQGDFTLSPFFGGQMSIFVGDVHLDGDYKWGLRIVVYFTPNWSAEFVYGANVTVHDPGDFR